MNMLYRHCKEVGENTHEQSVSVRAVCELIVEEVGQLLGSNAAVKFLFAFQ